jgi:sugar/nucleoside kinase (ribokinase family)
MQSLSHIEPIDYLVIGHVTKDLTDQGTQSGGTASYASLTARSFGLRVGIVTALGAGTSISMLDGIQIASLDCEQSTTFKNITVNDARIQYVYHVAPVLDISLVPEMWRTTSIVHLGPIAQEVEPNLVRYFPQSFIGVTPQGWLRQWNQEGRISPGEWPEASFVLENSSAAVLSIEDIRGDEKRIDELASSIRILVVTEGAAGCRVYWNGEVRHFNAPSVTEIDSTGAGDIFATAFFIRLNATHDPWESARFANMLAAKSVTRMGLNGIPFPQEIKAEMIEVLKY